MNFLNNPKVAHSTLIQKRNFLASKGLSDKEIQQAFEKVGIFEKMSDFDDNKDETRVNITQPMNYKHQMTTFEKIKDIISSAALISGIAYGIYVFYKVQSSNSQNLFGLWTIFPFHRNSSPRFYSAVARRVIRLMSSQRQQRL